MVAAIAGLMASAVALVIVIDHQHLKDEVETYLSDTLDRQVSIDGPMHLRIGEHVYFSAERMHIAATSWSDQRYFAQARLIEIQLDLTSILSDTIIVNSVNIDGLRVNLESNSDGANNWTFGSNDTAQAVQDETEEAEEDERFELPVRFDQITLTDTDLTLSTAQRSEAVRMSLASVRHLVMPDASGRLNINGDFNETPIAIAATVKNIASLQSFRDVDIDLEGALGEISLTAGIVFDDLFEPGRPVAQVLLTGPNAEYLTDLLDVQALTTGPLEFKFDVQPTANAIHLELAGQYGEFVVKADGVFDDLRTLDKLQLDFSAGGPAAGRLVKILGVHGIPEDPFVIDVSLNKDGPELVVKTLNASLGESRVNASGVFANFPDLVGAELTARAYVPDISRYAELTRLDSTVHNELSLQVDVRSLADETADVQAKINALGLTVTAQGNLTGRDGFEGSSANVHMQAADVATLASVAGLKGVKSLPATLDARLERRRDSTQIRKGDLVLANNQLAFSGVIGDEPLVADSALEFNANINRLNGFLTQLNLAADAIPDEKLNLSGQVSISNNRLQIGSMHATLAGTELELKGQVTHLDKLPQAKLSFEIASDNIATLDTNGQLEVLVALPVRASGQLVATDSIVGLNNLNVTLENTTLAGSIELDRATFDKVRFSITGKSPDILTLLPDLAEAAPTQTVPLSLHVMGELADTHLSLKTLELKLARGAFTASGNISPPPTYTGSDLAVTVKVPDVSELSVFVGRDLPQDKLDLTLRFEAVPDGLKVEHLTATLGRSDLSGDFMLRSGDVPHYTARLTSRLLDMHGYLDPDESEDQIETPGRVATSDRLIPDLEVPFDLLRTFNADVHLNVAVVEIGRRTLHDFRVMATLADGALNVDEFQVTGKDDSHLNGRLGLWPGPVGGTFRARLKGQNLELGLPAETQEELAALPHYDLTVAFTTEGATVAEMAGNMNGYIKMAAGKGVIKNSMLNLFANDVVDEIVSTVNPFRKRDPATNLSCSVVLGVIENGQFVGKPFLVMLSDRIKIVADTEINLKTEALDVDVATVAQKGLGLSLGDLVNPYIRITGTLARPALTLDKKATVVEGSAAVATAGLSILALNLKNRFLSDKDPCGKAVKDAEVQFAELEKRYGEAKP